MIPVSYYAPGEVTSPKFAYAFARGCQGTVTNETDLFPGPVALFGSPARWPVLRQAQAEGRDWYYADHGYFGRKARTGGGYLRVTKNAYQHDGSGEYAPDRFRRFGRFVYPWRMTGSHVLVCPNSDVYFRLHGLDARAWLQNVLQTLALHTDRTLKVRWKGSGPIQPDLEDAWAVVVFSSAAALDALIYGVPVFVLAPFAAGARMGLADLTQIEAPVYPDDREPFLWALACHQWTLSEMVAGVAWRDLQEAQSRAA